MQKRLDVAAEEYRQGVKATDTEARGHFIRAVESYQAIEKEGRSGELYYNMGNSYYMLQDYPIALYYYYKASELIPSNRYLKRHIALTKDKLLLPQKERRSLLQRLFFARDLLSSTELFAAVFIFSSFAFLFYSLSIWSRKGRWRTIALLCSIPAVYLLFNEGWFQYVRPISGVVARDSVLYGQSRKKIVDLPAGIKVAIIDVLPSGAWLQVRTEKREEGYLPVGEVLAL
ncbi:hypothetical protein JYU14_02765 [Simkania negevensis]|uniref:SH3b domain-containing protein n=1 Tax=Simkania negevensis TaxID=83561 RepID=A0ABS3AS51_9BACT|nr:hypothetical protein [Simkania negevensis]